MICIGFLSAPVYAAEPHLQQALDHLKEARAQLEKAVYGKPQQKEKAIEAVDEAIKHVQRAMGE